MDVLLYLSGENTEISKAEANAVVEGYNNKICKIYERGRIYALSCERFPFERIATAKIMCEFIGYGSDKDLDDIAKKAANKISGSFRVTGYSIGKFKDALIERKFGNAIKNQGENLNVRLENYENEVVIMYNKNEKSENEYFIGISKNREKFFQRIPSNRPFVIPVTMHPKLARTIVNLARVKEGDRILDPFCGSGAILVEAGLMHIEIFGRDIKEYMVEGCKKNLDFYRVKYKRENLKVGDALKIKKKDFFDAIVTDLPYGRSSYTTDKDIKKLYDKFIIVAYNLLRKGKFAVIMSEDKIDYNFYKFKCIEEHFIRVHKDLTRRICVLKKE